ncbi:MAG: hypothetical protein ACYTFY_23595 [Planctomycetota bacterium]
MLSKFHLKGTNISAAPPIEPSAPTNITALPQPKTEEWGGVPDKNGKDKVIAPEGVWEILAQKFYF